MAARAASSQSRLPPGQCDTLLSWANVTVSLPEVRLQKNQLLTAHLVESNRLDIIRCTPATRVMCKAWCRPIIAEYGSLHPCVADEAGPVFAVQASNPFADADDYLVEWNDWPYGIFGAGLTHSVVWSKVRLSIGPDTRGGIESFGRRICEDDVCGEVEEGRVLVRRRECCGFRLGRRCRVLGGLERIHVLVRRRGSG